MAYDDLAAYRMRAELAPLPGVVEKKMFGGVAFMLNGNLACGVHGSSLIVRVGPERYQEALDRPFTRPFDMSGKPMTGWVFVDPGGFDSDPDLKYWIQWGITFAASLPKK